MANSIIKFIEDLGKDIVKGVETAAKVPGVSEIPVAGPIIVEVGTVLSALESKGNTTLTSDQISQIVQIISAAQTVKQTVTAPISGS